MKVEKKPDLHSAYITAYILFGETFAQNKSYNNIYGVLMDVNENVGFVNVFPNHFTVYFREVSFNNFFLIRVITKLEVLGLKRKILSDTTNYKIYQFDGKLEALLEGLMYLEKEMKGKS